MSTIRRFLARFYTCKKLFQCFIISGFVSSILLATTVLLNNRLSGESSEPIFDPSRNYFQSIDDIFTGYLVKNDKCTIPEIDPWSSSILPFIAGEPFFNCKFQPYFNLTYATNNTLVINENVLNSYGYSIEDVNCCYQTIHRIQQSRESYDKEADNQYRYSEDCFKMERVTKPKAEFVKVLCKSKSWFGWLHYENFYMIAILAKKPFIEEKLQYWKKYRTYQSLENNVKESMNSSLPSDPSFPNHPPNVIVIGLDSISRLNFHRFMHRTRKILKTDLKSVEMNGYTKVGENTFPNMAAFLASSSMTEYENSCSPSWLHLQDDCPHIWKEFNQRNYLTAFLEDAPELAIFNYLKTGFVNPPTDFYIRPFMLAAYNGQKIASCINYQRPEEMTLNYILDLSTLAHSERVPFFIMTWLTDLTHDKLSNVQAIDNLLAETLLKLQERGILKNTLLFVMGDHGYRFLDARSTSSGWFEAKLPAMYIKLPDTLVELNPSWLDALKYNSKQLTTPFDMHMIFKEVLMSHVHKGFENVLSSDFEWSTNTTTSGLKMRGISPLTKISNRTCEEADVPLEFCACASPVEYISNATFIKLAGESIINTLNSVTPRQCSKLDIKKIIGAATFGEKSEASSIHSDLLMIVIGIITTPGDLQFESVVKYNKTSSTFEEVPLSRIERTNKYKRPSNCLYGRDYIAFKHICNCI